MTYSALSKCTGGTMQPHSTVELAHVATPVFVDPVGRRKFLVRLVSVLLAVALSGLTVATAVAVLGAPSP